MPSQHYLGACLLERGVSGGRKERKGIRDSGIVDTDLDYLTPSFYTRGHSFLWMCGVGKGWALWIREKEDLILLQALQGQYFFHQPILFCVTSCFYLPLTLPPLVFCPPPTPNLSSSHKSQVFNRPPTEMIGFHPSLLAIPSLENRMQIAFLLCT